MDGPPNPLIDNTSQRLPGWSMLAFLVAAPLIGLVAIWLLPERTNLPVLAAFFTAGLLGVAVAVLPLGRNAPAALGLRPVGWRPIVLAVRGHHGPVLRRQPARAAARGVKQVTEGIQGTQGAPDPGRPGPAGPARGRTGVPRPALRLAGRPLEQPRGLRAQLAGLRSRPCRARAHSSGPAAGLLVRLAALAHRLAGPDDRGAHHQHDRRARIGRRRGSFWHDPLPAGWAP